MITRKFAIGVSVLAALTSTACSRKPKDPKDQVSYTIGVQFGKSLRSQNLSLNDKMVARGIADGLNDQKIALSEDEMQSAMMKLNEERQKEMAVDADKNKQESEAFLSKNKTAEGVQITASGLQYRMTKEGNGPTPQDDDVVVVNYKGSLVNGKEFDSSYKRNTPAEFPVKGVIPGWTEGLKLMKKGGKATFYIPPELAYGDRPRQNIPGNAALIFEVELLDVKPAPKAPGGPPAAGGKKKH